MTAWDNELKFECTGERDDHGDRRYCLPPDTVSQVYTDSACTKTAALWSGCGIPAPGKLVTYDELTTSADACAQLDSFYKLGKARPEKTYYEPSDGECVVHPLSGNQWLFELGEQVPRSALASFKVTITE